MKWKPIKTAPKDGTWIIVIVDGIHPETKIPFIPNICYWEEGGWNDNNFFGAKQPDYTHWMPLPEPPCPSLKNT